MRCVLVYLFILSTLLLCELAGSEQVKDLFVEGITVDLQDPTFSQGILKTEKGGVVTGKNIRVQAQKITYTRKMVEGKLIFSLEAEEDVMLEIKDRIFVGSKLNYDFAKGEGRLYDGVTMVEPWFIGGETVILHADGRYEIVQATITTSEGKGENWQLGSSRVFISRDRVIRAKDVLLRFVRIPFFWVPRINIHSNALENSPLDFHFHVGRGRGTRLSAFYRIWETEEWKFRTRLDYNFKRGLGGGVETEYNSSHSNAFFKTRNYVADDLSQRELDRKRRYLFDGRYHRTWSDELWSANLQYQKISDPDMISDYRFKDFSLQTSRDTELLIKRHSETWFSRLRTRVRLNQFRTVKTEIPSLFVQKQPWELCRETGVIANFHGKAEYLDYRYAQELMGVVGFNSPRVELGTQLFRPFHMGPITATPELQATAVYYGNSFSGDPYLQGIARGGLHLTTVLERTYASFLHRIEPYVHWDHYTSPSVNLGKHYLFDIEDGFAKLSVAKIGVRQIFIKEVTPVATLDLYTYGLYRQQGTRVRYPWSYAKGVWYWTPHISLGAKLGWDQAENELGEYNLHLKWTVNPDLAFSAEMRYRNAFSWRRLDEENFTMDALRSYDALAASPVSDQRSIYLIKAYWKLLPECVLELESRHGQKRLGEGNFNEYKIVLTTVVDHAWKIRWKYGREENGHHFGISLSLTKKALGKRLWKRKYHATKDRY